MENGSIPTGILFLRGWGGGWGRVYRSILTYVMLVMDTCTGGRGQVVLALYHPHISRHAYFKRGGLDVRRESTSALDSTACRCLYSFSKVRIQHNSILMLAWFLVGAL